MKLAESTLDLIGNTPMVKLARLSQKIPAEIWVKLEYFNPSGSIKDRIAHMMIAEAEKRGAIKPGYTIIEPTSGNTGIALSYIAAIKGYNMIAVMPEVESAERIKMMELLGAKVELVKCVDKDKGLTKDDVENALKRAQELCTQIPNSFMPNQFTNPDNPKAHRETTAKEIIAQTNNGQFQAFVAACGTGGTFTGISSVLKEKYPAIKRYVVEPSTSAVLSGCAPGFHNIQGIGEGFIPEVMNINLADELIQTSDQEAVTTARSLWKEGVLSGLSGGANVAAALKIGQNMQPGETIVTIIPDTGLRYFSTELFL
jgi:cysteine synthase